MPLTRPLSESVVVITGASSGIGAATALALADRGARLALAARGEGPLHEVAERCRRLGGEALPVPTDVADPEQVERLAEAAEERFGRIDAWVNGAAVVTYGRPGAVCWSWSPRCWARPRCRTWVRTTSPSTP